jgi:molybdenum cofactor biosynthesis enzyme MoaA
MRKRTKEENAAYARAQRAKKRAQKDAVSPAISPVSPAAETPKHITQNISPVTPAVDCAECSRLRLELGKARAQVMMLTERLRQAERGKVTLPHRPPVERPTAQRQDVTPTPTKDEARKVYDAAMQEKMRRISTLSTGRTIGTIATR